MLFSTLSFYLNHILVVTDSCYTGYWADGANDLSQEVVQALDVYCRWAERSYKRPVMKYWI